MKEQINPKKQLIKINKRMEINLKSINNAKDLDIKNKNIFTNELSINTTDEDEDLGIHESNDELISWKQQYNNTESEDSIISFKKQMNQITLQTFQDTIYQVILKQYLLRFLIIFTTFILNFLLLQFIISSLALIAFFVSIYNIFENKNQNSVYLTIGFFGVFCYSICVIMVMYYSYCTMISDQLNNYDLWFLDAFFLYFFHQIIKTYLRVVKLKEFQVDFSMFKLFTLINDLQEMIEEMFRILTLNTIDFPLQSSNYDQKKDTILERQMTKDKNEFHFNTLISNHLRNSDSYTLRQQRQLLFDNLNEFLFPSLDQLLIIQHLNIFRVICCMVYIQKDFYIGWSDIIKIFFIALFQFNEVCLLNSSLSNYDLRRKAKMVQKINKTLKMKGSNIDDCIDITSVGSIQTWEYSFRLILEFFSGMQKKLENAFIIILLFYLFNLNIIICSFCQNGFILSKDSILMNPLIIISSIFTFVILSVLILYRLFHGQQLNDTLEESEEIIINLAKLYDDFIKQYEYYFNQRNISSDLYKRLIQKKNNQNNMKDQYISQLQNIQEIDRNDFENQIDDNDSLQNHNSLFYKDVIVSKIKFKTEDYVINCQQYEGKVYGVGEVDKLHKKILKNCFESFKRLRYEMIRQGMSKQYKFLNFFKIKYRNAILIIVICYLTFIPPLMIKFYGFFQSSNHF